LTIGDLFASSLVAAFVAFLLTAASRWQRNAKESRALLRGIQLDINHAAECAEAYTKDSEDKPWAPAYRISREFLREGLLKLAANSHLTTQEVEALHKLYISAGEANRSLDLLEELHNRTPLPVSEPLGANQQYILWEQMELETNRARLKFGDVSEAIPAARKAADAALARLAWFAPSE
jgi:hypothetical protein